MLKWIRDKFGISMVQNQLYDVKETLDQLSKDVARLSNSVRVSNTGLGRIIAKIDPMLAVSEDDPVRKQKSKELGEEVIKRIEAEQAVRDHYGYSDPR